MSASALLRRRAPRRRLLPRSRAGLRRMDGQIVRSLSPRDRLVREIEEWIIARERDKLSDEELEQIALAEGVELAVLKGSIQRTLAKGPPKTGL